MNSTYIIEKKQLEREKSLSKKVLESEQYLMSERLNGQMGKSIDEILMGKKKIKLTFKEKLNNLFNRFLHEN